MNREAQLKKARELVRERRKGAFSPLAHHPVVQALLIPFGGYGALQIVEFLRQLSA